MQWGNERRRKERGKNRRLIISLIGQQLARLRAKEVAETGRKINIEVIVRGWRLR